MNKNAKRTRRRKARYRSLGGKPVQAPQEDSVQSKPQHAFHRLGNTPKPLFGMGQEVIIQASAGLAKRYKNHKATIDGPAVQLGCYLVKSPRKAGFLCIHQDHLKPVGQSSPSDTDKSDDAA